MYRYNAGPLPFVSWGMAFEFDFMGDYHVEDRENRDGVAARAPGCISAGELA